MFRTYIESMEGHNKEKAHTSLEKFLTRMKSYAPEARDAWIRVLCRAVIDEHRQIPLQFQLLSELIVPYLIGRVKIGFHRDPDAALWLVGLMEQIYGPEPLNRQLAVLFMPPPREAKLQILRRLVEWDPNNTQAQSQLQEILSPSTSEGRLKRLEYLANSLAYAIHEVPAGVLFGPDGATKNECDVLLKEVDELETLATKEGIAPKYSQSILKWRYYFHTYKDYLENPKRYRNFADYLQQNPMNKGG